MTKSAVTAAVAVAPLALTGVVAWLVAFGLLLVVVASWFLPPSASFDAPPIVREGRQLAPNTPYAQPAGNSIVVANRASALTVLAVVSTPFRAADYGVVTIDASDVPFGVTLALVWVRSDDVNRPYEQPIEVSRARTMPVALDLNPEWRGDVRFLALGVKGSGEKPLEIRSVTLEPVALASTIGDTARSWARVERWDGRSINVLFGGAELQRFRLPPLAFAASLISAAAIWVHVRRRRERLPLAALALPFLIGWFLVDVRWQWNLFAQARETVADFGGRSHEQRHLIMEDGDLFRFVQAALVQLPNEPVRIFATSDFEYFRRRAGYHLYPHNVLAYDWEEPSVIRPGDYVLFYQRTDVRFDSRAGELQWANGRRLKAQPLVARRGAGLFLAKEPAP